MEMYVCVMDACVFVGNVFLLIEACVFDGNVLLCDEQEGEGVAEGAEEREGRRRSRCPVGPVVQPHYLTSWKPRFRPNQVRHKTNMYSNLTM